MIKKHSSIIIPILLYLFITSSLLYNAYYGFYSLLEMLENVFNLSLLRIFFWDSNAKGFKHIQYVRKAWDYQNSPSVFDSFNRIDQFFGYAMYIFIQDKEKKKSLC